ncbi:MAG: fumarylacetoacetate hydrolase family protein [Candidatus Aminicenantes bacterium]|nr:fumarylacetoacetate hydrolase family protein [Candidatus Aminicenantes bacterium]
MKIYRFLWEQKELYGVLREGLLYPLRGSVFESSEIEDYCIPIGKVKILPPVTPTKIIGVGVNYRDHAQEMGRTLPEEPLIFLKPPSAIIGPNEAILFPRMAHRIDYEGELAVIIKKEVHDLDDEADLKQVILGYTCFNDVTARDLQLKDGQFTRAKSFDTFAPCGPCIATDLDPSHLTLKTFLNGKLRQSASTSQMIFPVYFLIRFISRIMTLYPGDIITTGTPAGVGPMNPGDRVDVQIEGIGTLSNIVLRVREAEKA